MKFKKVATIVAGLTVVIPVSLASQATQGVTFAPPNRFVSTRTIISLASWDTDALASAL